MGTTAVINPRTRSAGPQSSYHNQKARKFATNVAVRCVLQPHSRGSEWWPHAKSLEEWCARRVSNLRRNAGVSEAGARSRNPERSDGSGPEKSLEKWCAREIRTPDPLVRSQMLYPAELRARLGKANGESDYNGNPPAPAIARKVAKTKVAKRMWPQALNLVPSGIPAKRKRGIARAVAVPLFGKRSLERRPH